MTLTDNTSTSSEYWLRLASSILFFKKSLRQCLDIIHRDIVATWNFRDGDMVSWIYLGLLISPTHLSSKLLAGNEFKAMMLQLVQDLADPDASNPNSGLWVPIEVTNIHHILSNRLSSQDLSTIKQVLDVATPISAGIAPVVSALGVSVAFGSWLFDAYKSTYVQLERPLLPIRRLT